MNNKITNASIKETKILANEISLNIKDGDLILLSGEMGSGKTQFVKFLCESLNTITSVSSPSFLILNQYETKNGFNIFHFDFYRLADTKDLVEIGFFEILDSNEGLILIEWPNNFRSLFSRKKNIIDIYFNFIKDNINLRDIIVEG